MNINLDNLQLFYLTIAILTLALAIFLLPTLVHGPKPSRSR